MTRRTFTERRRSMLARRLDTLEAMEPRAMITESLGILTLGIGVPTVAAFGRTQDGGEAQGKDGRTGSLDLTGLAAAEGRKAISIAARRAARQEAGWQMTPVAAAPARTVKADASNDWLTLFREPAQAEPPISMAPVPRLATPAAQAGGGSSPGAGGGMGRGAITPLRVPSASAESTGASSPSSAGAVGSTSTTASPGGTGPSTDQGQSAPASRPTSQPSNSFAAPAGLFGSFFVGDLDVDLYDVQANASPAALGQFDFFPLYNLDFNNGTVLFPGGHQLATLAAPVDLRAQVRDTSVASYSWDTTNLTHATSITGTSTYNLRFAWVNNNATAATDSVTLTVMNSNGDTEVQTYFFQVPAGSRTGGPWGGSWPDALAPNLVLPGAPSFSSHGVSIDANSGALDIGVPLPAYNPNLPALSLTYDSLLADPRPIFVDHHTLDDTLAIPTQVSGQLTFNGVAGTTYYYDTSQFIPGDIQQFALQANATALSTGRYSYSISVGDIRGTTTTTVDSGTATILNGSGNSFGSGWTLNGLQRITSASGGVILDLGMGGRSLWFSGSGPYTSPAGDFSTLAAVSGGGYTRTMTDGTVHNFNSGGYQTSAVDRNGLATTFVYSSGDLSTITDPYGKITTFAYSSGKLSTITDPANRIATFTHSGSNLTGVALPDGNAWSYGYDGSGRMTQVTDPRSKTVTVAYDGAARVSTITRPDSTTETFEAYQVRGWTNSGTSVSPAVATLLAEAHASYTDPNGHTTDLRPDWNGQGLTNQVTDPDGNVTTFDRDGNGLATIAIDRLNRITTYGYDNKGNVTAVAYPDGNTEARSYNSFAQPTSFTNVLSHTTDFTYDGNGNLTVIQDPLGNLTTMTYTGNGKVATVKDARSNTTSSAYDSQDRLTTVTHPDSSTKVIGYDSYGNSNSVTDERGNVTTNSYDALNRPTGTTDALTNRTTIVYDAAGNRTVVQAPLSRTTTFAYDVMNRVTTVTDPLSHSTVTAYDSGGNLRTVTDPLSRVITFAYDSQNRRTVVTNPLGHSTTTTYDAEGQVLTVTDPLGRVTTTTYNSRGWKATVTDPLGKTTTQTYTATGKPATVSQFFGVGSTVLVSYAYDNNDRLIAQQDALNHVTTLTYDQVGNRTSVKDANSNTTTYAYDSRNRLTTVTDPLSHSTVYGYDSGGNRTTVSDPLGHTTTTQHDALNRATTVTDARGGQSLYSYDAAGRRTVVVDPVGNRTTFGYDAADRLTTMTDPLSHSATWSYDNANQLTDQTDRNGRRTTFSYDSGGRQTGETWVGASPSQRVTYTYDAADQLTGIIDANATLTFTYDSGGNQLTAATSGPGSGQPSVTLTSAYDATHNRTSLTDNLMSVGITTFVYDSAFRLEIVAASYGGTAGPAVAFAHDSANRLTSQSRVNGAAPTQVNTTFSYDNANRVTTITHGADVFNPMFGWVHTPVATYVYGYDDADRVTSEQNAEGTVTFAYDATDQLTGASGSRAETYTYDSGGNRTMSGYTTGTGNRLTASPGHTYTYDDEGNRISDTNTSTTVVTSYTYDYHNRLTGVTVGGTVVATYVYDALGRRIGVNENATQTWTVYDGQNPYTDFNGSGTLQQRYLYGPAVDQILARTSSGGTTAWYLPDRLGSVRDVADPFGTVLDHIVYDSFGSVVSESNSVNGGRFKFTGREFDSVVGIYYYRARYYDAHMGRFLSQDPKGFDANDLNLYRYVGNCVVNASDATGLEATNMPQSGDPDGDTPFDATMRAVLRNDMFRTLEDNIVQAVMRRNTVTTQMLDFQYQIDQATYDKSQVAHSKMILETVEHICVSGVAIAGVASVGGVTAAVTTPLVATFTITMVAMSLAQDALKYWDAAADSTIAANTKKLKRSVALYNVYDAQINAASRDYENYISYVNQAPKNY